MNRDKTLKQERVKYVKKTINESVAPVSKTVAKLSKRLFLAESTIWNDYTKWFICIYT